MIDSFFERSDFNSRHLGVNPEQLREMLGVVGFDDLDIFVRSVLPTSIADKIAPDSFGSISEREALDLARVLGAKNSTDKKIMIGQGYNPSVLPPVLQRHFVENSGWYSAYTPYQAEISQGRLELLLSFQQMIMDITGFDLANASLLDEATAAAEAMALSRRVSKSKSDRYFVDRLVFDQTIKVIETRASGYGIELVVGDWAKQEDREFFGALFQYPNKCGSIDLDDLRVIRSGGAIVTLACDILALTILRSPFSVGADIAVGSAQRFGLALGFGGPHAAFLATRDEYKRSVAGRIIGVSKDSRGGRALRMALQTREQHIRRERATSNICTSQVLLANLAALFAIWHGSDGLRKIARRVNSLALDFLSSLPSSFKVCARRVFDTVALEFLEAEEADFYLRLAEDRGFLLNLMKSESGVVLSVSFNELSTLDDVRKLSEIFGGEYCPSVDPLSSGYLRDDDILTSSIFRDYRSESKMLRFLRRLQNRDIALDTSMIPLGSCTMKLNPTAAMMPITWPEWMDVHPLGPARGYEELISDFEDLLKKITAFDAISFQPNSGAQGEYAGLLAIRRYHAANAQFQRDICLIPSSAHGTNPASAKMIGFEVVTVSCDRNGNVDISDLREKISAAGDRLACLMITYPSTHGVFEERIMEIIDCVHASGGQVYMDGANLNAMLGLVQVARLGVDVSHMNLHKTFSIPHGGGGPGVGPIGVRGHLKDFLPVKGKNRVSASEFGSALVLLISYLYVRMSGLIGLQHHAKVALLNANYIAKRLNDAFPVLYKGRNGLVAHECILDLRPIKVQSGVTEVDIAKRLMDYGFHSPTMSFPVPGTFMIEPTESESKEEIDRFINAMLSIRSEIQEIIDGKVKVEDSVLRHAPHSISDVSAKWDRVYSREKAFFPLDYLRENKVFPFVNRIDDVAGDRNLICGCS